jgi:nitrate reductase gamma subunit
MTPFIYVIIYAAAIVFVLACIVRVVRYARVPVHLRWELYPVPHEDPDRVKHGGSYFEELEWWNKPTHFNLLGELRFMVPEMLFLKGLHEFNRMLWYRSFPFHFGLYLLIGTLAMLTLGAALSVFAPTLMAHPLGYALSWLPTLTGTAGLGLALLGALGLLVRRVTDEDLKIYTTKGDIFNLLFFIVAFGVVAAGCLVRPTSAPDLLAISKGLITFDTSIEIPGLLAAGLFLSGILVAYIPMTHMSHFIAKYFTYHSVRWDDAPNRRGGKLEARLAEYLTYRPTWAAAHVGADGKKTWAQVATTNPAQEVKK